MGWHRQRCAAHAMWGAVVPSAKDLSRATELNGGEVRVGRCRALVHISTATTPEQGSCLHVQDGGSAVTVSLPGTVSSSDFGHAWSTSQGRLGGEAAVFKVDQCISRAPTAAEAVGSAAQVRNRRELLWQLCSVSAACNWQSPTAWCLCCADSSHNYVESTHALNLHYLFNVHAYKQEPLELWLSGFNCSLVSLGSSAPAGSAKSALLLGSFPPHDPSAGTSTLQQQAQPAQPNVLDYLLRHAFQRLHPSEHEQHQVAESSTSRGQQRPGQASSDEYAARESGSGGSRGRSGGRDGRDSGSAASTGRLSLSCWLVVGKDVIDVMRGAMQGAHINAPGSTACTPARPHAATRPGSPGPNIHAAAWQLESARSGSDTEWEEGLGVAAGGSKEFAPCAVEAGSLDEARRLVAVARATAQAQLASLLLPSPSAPPSPQAAAASPTSTSNYPAAMHRNQAAGFRATMRDSGTVQSPVGSGSPGVGCDWRPPGAAGVGHVFVRLGLLRASPARCYSQVTLVDLADPAAAAADASEAGGWGAAAVGCGSLPASPSGRGSVAGSPGASPLSPLRHIGWEGRRRQGGLVGVDMSPQRQHQQRWQQGVKGLDMSPQRQQRQRRRLAALQQATQRQLANVHALVLDLAARHAGECALSNSHAAWPLHPLHCWDPKQCTERECGHTRQACDN